MDARKTWCAGRHVLEMGEIKLNLDTQELSKGDKVEALSPKLFHLLLKFMKNPGSILSRKELMRDIWDTDYLGDTRTLYVHVRLLREKIEDDPSDPVYIRTVRGVGYWFDVPE